MYAIGHKYVEASGLVVNIAKNNFAVGPEVVLVYLVFDCFMYLLAYSHRDHGGGELKSRDCNWLQRGDSRFTHYEGAMDSLLFVNEA